MTHRDIVKDMIYRLENSLIQQKIFLDSNNQPIFITNVQIQNETGLSEEDVVNAIKLLETNEFIIFDNVFGISADKNIKFLIRSRIYHLIWCLYRSTNRTRSFTEFNVADYQYIRHIKRRPRLSKNLEDIFNDLEIKKNFNYPKNSLFTDIITHVKNTTEFKKISNFQLDSTKSILKNLETRKKPKGLVIVAGTGAGKSFAYQYPILLWIINKKFKKFSEYLKRNIKENELHVNCSALLIFPRNALAQDQFEYISFLIDKINEQIDKFPDAVGRKFLKIKKPIPDFQGKVSSELKERYGNDSNVGYPDIIITNPESLERRILNPECSPVYRSGIDCVIYDEVHLWDGIKGAQIASLNTRLQNLFQENSMSPLFVGMSATIDKPDWHCQKLFSLITEKRPERITQGDADDTEIFSTEHHLILKPRSGRAPLGVAIDTTSCLIHNRRNGLVFGHDDTHVPSLIDKELKPKSLTFIDSLNQTGRFTNKLNDFEYFWAGHAQQARNANSNRPYRSYIFHYRPEQRNNVDCEQCVNRTSPNIFTCPSYVRGECWYYSLDDGNQHANVPYGNWHPIVPGNRLTIPRDNIRSKRVSSLENTRIRDKYDYFYFQDSIWIPDGLRPSNTSIFSDIDNVVATSTLEVGVDFKNIKEIIQFGDIRSPSSYKQKAGRGAREGNTEDGLFVMSVINDSSISYYHFKHFSRLVKSSLDPLKLEIGNPDVIKSNCFFSIFDFIAYNNINLFRIIKLNENEIDQEYVKALKLLKESRMKKFIERFLAKFNISDPTLVKEVLEDTTDFLKMLSTKNEIEINSVKEKRTLHEWLIRSVNDPNTLQEIQKQLHIDAIKKQQEEIINITNEIENLQKTWKKHFPDDGLLEEKLNELKGELFG